MYTQAWMYARAPIPPSYIHMRGPHAHHTHAHKHTQIPTELKLRLLALPQKLAQLPLTNGHADRVVWVVWVSVRWFR